MIDQDKIQELYNEAVEECFGIFPEGNWKHSPKGIDLTGHKSKYGMATAEGMVLINKAFIGTDSIIKLNNTIRHELAHLAVGLNQHHNKIFRRFENLFKATATVSEEQIDNIKNNMSYKWQVIAHLVDGTQRDLGGMHRKNKVYSEYPQNGRSMLVDNIKVERFEFIDRDKNEEAKGVEKLKQEHQVQTHYSSLVEKGNKPWSALPADVCIIEYTSGNPCSALGYGETEIEAVNDYIKKVLGK